MKPASTTATVTQAVTTPPEPKKVTFTGDDRVPANWSIRPAGDGIEAANATTGNSFKGSVADFNKALRSI